jgi:23S rRNA (cytidine1920-2'-O)/16S rRNA (cytidine1409-2'-O)-methyltransferase
VRLDQALVERGLCDSRETARRVILAGEVRVGGHRVDKPAARVLPGAAIEVAARPPFVSRGGLKLAGALDAFGVDPSGRVCLDIGASTGGFTDCLLQRGARKVLAFDVGTNQLAWKLREDPRVVARERFNARHLTAADVPEPVDLLVADVSFISLALVLAPAFAVLAPGGDAVVLIKPQFELGRGQVGRGGLVRDPALHAQAVEKIRRFVVDELGGEWRGCIPSAITGSDGNQEFPHGSENPPPHRPLPEPRQARDRRTRPRAHRPL